MAFVPPKDRVLEHSTSNSQTVFTVTGALDTSFNAFSASMTTGDTTIGGVVEPGVAFKSGLLTYSGANQVTVTTAYDSKGTFSAGGVKEVFMGLPAASTLLPDGTQASTATQQTQFRQNIAAAPFDAMAYNGMQINGGVDGSQELGTTGATLVSGTNKYIADNWEVGYTNASGSATSAAQIAAASFPAALPGYNFALQIKAVAAFTLANGDLAHFRQRVEGNRVARLGWGTLSAQPIAIAFQFYSTVSGVSFVRVYNSAGIRAYYIEFTVAAGWQWVTLTIPGDTSGTWVKDTGIGLFIDIFATGKQASPAAPGSWAGAGSIQTTNSTNLLGTINNVVALTGFLLLPGLELPNSSRAPLIMRPFDQEYDLTQRYYSVIAPATTGAEVAVGGMLSNIQGYYGIRFPKVMRATPTCSVSAAADWSNNPLQSTATLQAGTAAQMASQSAHSFRLGLTSASTSAPTTGGLSMLQASNTSARIIADARL